jgi:hypothetical protein
MKVRGTRNIPIYTQKPIADVLWARYRVESVIVIGSRVKSDGTLEYLSTDGVAASIARLRESTIRNDTAGVIAFEDHLWRATYTTVANGFAAYAPARVRMPSTYDPQSGQEWTRSRSAYLPTDYAGRIPVIGRVLAQ